MWPSDASRGFDFLRVADFAGGVPIYVFRRCSYLEVWQGDRFCRWDFPKLSQLCSLKRWMETLSSNWADCIHLNLYCRWFLGVKLKRLATYERFTQCKLPSREILYWLRPIWLYSRDCANSRSPLCGSGVFNFVILAVTTFFLNSPHTLRQVS
jgi:hypothetical protein